MARARNIKPGFFLNDELAEMDPLARLLFAGLWCIADREGRLEDRPKKIKAEVLPYDACDVNAFLSDLEKHEFIIRYEIDGNKFIQIINFKKHQNPHIKEAASIIPAPVQNSRAPEKHSADIVQKQEKHTTNPADSLNPHTDSLNLIPKDNVCADVPAEKSSADDGAQSNETGKDEYTPEFEEFWSHYPRRLEKKKAYRAWDKRLKEKYPVESLITACINYASYCEKQHAEDRFIKHASTFLGPDKPFEEYIKGPPEQSTVKNKAEPAGWNTLRHLYDKYEKEEAGTQ